MRLRRIMRGGEVMGESSDKRVRRGVKKMERGKIRGMVRGVRGVVGGGGRGGED